MYSAALTLAACARTGRVASPSPATADYEALLAIRGAALTALRAASSDQRHEGTRLDRRIERAKDVRVARAVAHPLDEDSRGYGDASRPGELRRRTGPLYHGVET